VADSLEELLRACTVRVLGPRPGAGFFVAPGVVLTCAHVVGAETTLNIDWDAGGVRNHSASVLTTVADRGRPIPALDSDYPDVAVVHLKGLGGHACVGIDLNWPQQEDRFQIYGYPEEGGSAVLTPAVLSYRGKKGSGPTVFLDLASDQVKPGMSGAAVLNLRSRAVCGLVVASKDIGDDRGALAVTWSSMGQALVPHLQANTAFLESDSQWDRAKTAAVRSTATVTDEKPVLRVVGDRVSAAVELWRDRDELRQWLREMLLEGQRITSVVGRRGIGKSAVVAKVLADFEQPDPSRSPLEDLDGLVYLSTRTGATSLTLARVYESIAALAERHNAERLDRLWENLNVDALPELWTSLSHRRIVVVLDNLDDLQDESGELVDDGLVAFLESVARTPYPPRVITTSQRPLRLPPDLQGQVIVRPLDDGLTITDGVALLRDMDAGTGLILSESEERLGHVVRQLHGIPRGLELVARIIVTDDPFYLDTLLDSSAEAGTLLVDLVSRSFANLDETDRRLVGLLALAGVPLPRQAIPTLLDGLVDPAATRKSLGQLISTRQIGYDPEHQHVRLHPLDADYVRQSLLHDEAALQVDLDLKLADWYAAARIPRMNWRSVADVGPNQREYEHRWRAGEHLSALVPLADAADLLARKGEGRTLRAAIARAEPIVTESAGRVQIERCRYMAEFYGGSLERAEESALRGYDAAKAAAMPPAAAEFRVWRALAMRHRGDPAGAAAVFRAVLKNEGHALSRDDRLDAQFELGICLCYIGDWQAAETIATQLASDVRPEDDPHQRAREFDLRSLARLVARDFEGAIAAARRGIPIYESSSTQHDVAYLRNVCGVAQLYLDQIDAAEDELRIAADVAAEYGIPRLEGLCALNRAWCLMRASRWSEALTFASQAKERLALSGVKAHATAEKLAVVLATEQDIPRTEVRQALQKAVAPSRDNADIYTPPDRVISEVVEGLPRGLEHSND
jgi:hypothetical protein